MNERHGAEALALMELTRPRDRKSKVVETWRGRGRHGEGKEEEEDPGSRRRPAAAAAAAESEFDEWMRLEDASWDRGVDQGVEASVLPDRHPRRQPCVPALLC